MRVVAALGGNALLERGEKPDEDIQEHHVQQAADALAALARAQDLAIGRLGAAGALLNREAGTIISP